MIFLLLTFSLLLSLTYKALRAVLFLLNILHSRFSILWIERGRWLLWVDKVPGRFDERRMWERQSPFVYTGGHPGSE